MNIAALRPIAKPAQKMEHIDALFLAFTLLFTFKGTVAVPADQVVAFSIG